MISLDIFIISHISIAKSPISLLTNNYVHQRYFFKTKLCGWENIKSHTKGIF